MHRVQEHRTKIAEMRPALHTSHMVASLTLLHRRLALRALGRVIAYERERRFLLLLQDGALSRDIDARAAVEEIAVPAAVTQTAEGVGAVFADL